MRKDFDNWNTIKKQIHERTEAPFYRERQVFWCDLGVNVGYEQDGTGSKYARPVIVLKGFNRHVCLVAPLTTSPKQNPYHFPLRISYRDATEGTKKPQSSAIISQIRLIDTKRLDTHLGTVSEDIFAELKNAVKAML